VLISHGHADHFDRASLRALPGDPLLVVPGGLGVSARRTGRRVHEVAVNERLEIGGIRVIAVPARHRRWPLHPGAKPLGFLVSGSRGVYFAGDTALFPAMDRLAGHVDVALLPIGRWGPGVGPVRLTPQTAVEAASLVEARLVVPIHWGTFYLPGFRTGRGGWGSPDAGEAFAAEAADRSPSLEVRVLRPGEATHVDAGHGTGRSG
jgi:L-ascorbate metabolism protein UlaG (beta-lactamase superfamily)